MGGISSFRAKIGFFRPFQVMGFGYYVVGLTKIGMQPINYLHNGHDLEEKNFLNFAYFHGRQPLRPILLPGQKVHRPVIFFHIFLL